MINRYSSNFSRVIYNEIIIDSDDTTYFHLHPEDIQGGNLIWSKY